MLQDSQEALVQEELQREVVGANGEWLCLDVGLPMALGLDEDDELTLVGHELGVLGGHREDE